MVSSLSLIQYSFELFEFTIVFLYRHNHRETGSLSQVETHHIRKVLAGRNIDREYHRKSSII